MQRREMCVVLNVGVYEAMAEDLEKVGLLVGSLEYLFLQLSRRL